MSAVSSPNQPENGTVRWKSEACLQSTCPAMTGASAETKASVAEPPAMTTARRPAHLTPLKLTSVKDMTSAHASSDTGTLGRYHSWIAAAEKMAVNPQVGIQPTSSKRP